jgi:hypothetical protein
MAVLPPAMPVATPVRPVIVAIAVLSLLHPPPLMASLSVTALPWHTVLAPVIAAGKDSTVSGVVTLQPEGLV